MDVLLLVAACLRARLHDGIVVASAAELRVERRDGADPVLVQVPGIVAGAVGGPGQADAPNRVLPDVEPAGSGEVSVLMRPARPFRRPRCRWGAVSAVAEPGLHTR